MKILMMLDQPNLYGSEMHFLDLVDYFNQQAEVKVIVLGNGPLLKLLSNKKIDFTIIPTGWLPSLSHLKKAYTLIRSFSPDIIHSHQPKANFVATLLNILLRKNSIVTIHSHALDHSLVYKNIFKRKVVYMFHRFVQFFSEWGATKVIYVSHSSSKSSFFPKKVAVLYNWLNEAKYGVLFKNRSDTASGIIKIVSVGSVTFAKGFDLLIDLATILKHQPFTIDIVGSVENQFASELKQRVEVNKMSNIIFHGYQNDPSPYFKQADYFVLFSRAETFGLSYIEAMSFGLPVLCLSYATTAEIVPAVNSISNELSKHMQYLTDLQNNRERYNKISSLNRSYVSETFSYGSTMEKYKKFYSKLLEE